MSIASFGTGVYMRITFSHLSLLGNNPFFYDSHADPVPARTLVRILGTESTSHQVRLQRERFGMGILHSAAAGVGLVPAMSQPSTLSRGGWSAGTGDGSAGGEVCEGSQVAGARPGGASGHCREGKIG